MVLCVSWGFIAADQPSPLPFALVAAGAKYSPPLKYLGLAKRMGYVPLALVALLHECMFGWPDGVWVGEVWVK